VLVSLRPDETLASALRKLHGYKLTTVPVMEEHTAKAFQSAYMLDLMDLALYIVETDGRADMFNTRVDHIANSERREGEKGVPFVRSDATFGEAFRSLHHHRRVLVIDQATDRPIGMLSPTDVIRWVLEHQKHCPAEILAKPVSDLKCSTIAITAKQNEPMSEALRKFVGEGKSGIGVTDDHGRLVGNLSLADLRCLTPENAHTLLRLNVGAFLSETRKVPKEAVTCRPSTSLLETMRLLQRNHIHRVFVTDEQEKPLYVFSSSDVIRNLSP
jgi:CBS domain-containing protein